MNDPCRECEKFEFRNQFLSEYYIPISKAEDPNHRDRDLIGQALQKYHESEQKYKQLIKCAPDAIFIADADTGIILDANQKAAELIGIPTEHIVGMHQTQLHPENEIEKYKNVFHEHVQMKNTPASQELYVQHKDGHKIPVQINATVTQLGDKTIIYGIFRNITGQKKLQQELKERERKYRNLYNQAQVALFVTNMKGLLLDCNLATIELFGYSPDEPKENYLNKIYVTDYYVNKDKRNRFVEELQKYQQVKDFEAQLRRQDGTLFWVSIFARLSPIKRCIEGALYDITVSKVLTNMEKKILDIILQGKSNREIAKILKRSVRTIEDHRAHIMQKLNAHNLVELVQKAQSLHLHPRE